MASAREIQYIIKARDEATAIFKQLGQEGSKAAADIAKAFDIATGTISKQQKDYSKLQSIYKEAREGNRLNNFYFREGRAAVNALSFGILGLVSATSDADKTQQKFNKGLAEGFAAFQGIDFMLGALGAGPWGMVAAGAMGVAVAIKQITGNTDEAIRAQKELIEISKDFNKGIGLKEAKYEYNIFTKAIEESNNRIKIITGQIEELGKKRTVTMVNGIAVVTRANEGLIQSAYREIEAEKKHIAAWQIKADSYKEIIDSEELLEDIRKRQSGAIISEGNTTAALNEQIKIEEETLSHLTRSSDAYIKKQLQILALKAQLAEAPEEETKQPELKSLGKDTYLDQWKKDYTDATLYISQMERTTFRRDKDYELEILEEWYTKALADAEKFGLDRERINNIYIERETQIKTQAFLQQVNEAAQIANQITGIFEQASNQKYEAELNNLQYEQNEKQKALSKEQKAKLKAIDKELDAENLSADRKKKLTDEKNKINEEYEAKQEQLLEQYAEKEREIKQQQWQANKDYALTQAVINGAMAVTKAWAEMGPLGWVGAALTTAATAAQIAIISGQEMPKFAQGTPPGGFIVPPGFENDNFSMRVSSGERVVVTPANQSTSSYSTVNHFYITISAALSRQELVKLLKDLSRATGQTIEQIARNNSAQLAVGI